MQTVFKRKVQSDTGTQLPALLVLRQQMALNSSREGAQHRCDSKCHCHPQAVNGGRHTE